MKGYRITIGAAAAAFALSLSPVAAQERSRPADSPTVGTATSRDSGSSSGSSSSSSSGSNGSATTSSSGGTSNSGSSRTSGWTGSSNEAQRRAPVNPERTGYGDQRRAGSSASTVGAVPRGEAGGFGDSTALATPSADGVNRQSVPARSLAVPAYSRPRDGRPAIGAATERPDGYYADGHPYYYSTYVYNPYYGYYYDPLYSYSPYRNRYYWSPWGYGFGFGYMAYDPFFFGAYGYPGYYGLPSSFGLPYDLYDPYGGMYGGGAYGGGYYGGGGAGGGGGSSSQVYHGAGSLRLKVKPGNAQVFVDGYFVGTIDSFDGVFQRLSVEAGAHKIELRAEGYQTTTLDVVVIPNDTVTYEGKMIPRK